MQIKPLYRDPATGYLVEAQSGDSLNTATVAVFNEYIALIQNTATNTCCAIVDYTAIPITSNNIPTNILRTSPSIDCIILESGNEGDTVLIAATHGKLYTTPTSIDYTTSDTLYLSNTGTITTIAPSLSNGDHWLVRVGRLVNHFQFIFDPQPPVDLTSGSGYTGDIPTLSANKWLWNDGNALFWKSIKASDIAANAAITSFNISTSSLEVGQSINTPSFTASYNETPTSCTLRDNVNNTLQTLTNVNSFSSNYNFIKSSPGSVSFTLDAVMSSESTANTNLNWYYRLYYGAAIGLTAPSDLEYNQLSSGFAGTFNVNAGTNEFIYISFPSSFGTPTFYVGGFEGGIKFLKTISYTNPYGVIISYDIYQSDNQGLGNTTVTIQ